MNTIKQLAEIKALGAEIALRREALAELRIAEARAACLRVAKQVCKQWAHRTCCKTLGSQIANAIQRQGEEASGQQNPKETPHD